MTLLIYKFGHIYKFWFLSILDLNSEEEMQMQQLVLDDFLIRDFANESHSNRLMYLFHYKD